MPLIFALTSIQLHLIISIISCFRVTTPLRDYTKIKEQNCQLVTHYGGKKFNWPRSVAVGPNDEVVIADSNNKEVILFDKNLKLIRKFGQGSGDSKLNNPAGVAVGHNIITISEWDEHVVKKFFYKETTCQNLALMVVEMVNLIILKDCVSIVKVYCMLWIIIIIEFRCSERIMRSNLNLAPKDLIQGSLKIHVILLWTAVTKCM